MPIKGKCWSCGEEHYLTGQLLFHIKDGHWEYHMVCQICADYFKAKGVAQNGKID